VSSSRDLVTRRSFLEAAAPFALGLGTIVRGQTVIERGRFNDNDVPLAQDQLLKMVNAERTNARLNRLKLDDLACKVTSEHASDMAKGKFLSHWGTDGRKPYHRYSFAGGTDAVQENVSAGDNIESVTSTSVLNVLHDMHQSMFSEVPPNDGHRKTILFRGLTHVGFGIAVLGHSVRLDELYVARYIDVDPIPRQIRTKANVLLSGKVLSNRHVLTGADIYYEPLPSPPDIKWLRELRSYGMPEPKDILLPRLPPRYSYPNGSSGTIEIDSSGRFRVSVSLSKKPGINTIMVWLKEGRTGTAFPASQICIRVE
jgi:uncharacterized protein YkwD